MTGIGENTLAQPVKPPLRERRACLAKLVKNRLTLTSAGSLPPDRRAVSRSADSACEKMHETSAPRSPRSVALAM